MHSRCRNADAQLAALPVSDEVLVPIGTFRNGITLGDVASLFSTYSGTAADLVAHSAGDSVADPGTDFTQWSQRIVVQDNLGTPYVLRVALSAAHPLDGAIYRFPLEIAASADPTVRFYDGSVDGAIRQELAGDPDNEQYLTAVFTFESGSWNFTGYER